MIIALIGYGKMGKTIERLAIAKGHQTVAFDQGDDLTRISETGADVAIEFTEPKSTPGNLRICLEQNIPVVCGTTGWLEHKPEIEELCRQTTGSFFYASNYSLGVQVFFRLNRQLASMMARHPGYRADIHEIHHTQKKDSPSGTAITLAEGIIRENPDYQTWSDQDSGSGILPITSERIDPFPGTHTVTYRSTVDDLVITHQAHSREGFAAGALAVAEWIPGRKGVLTMDDFLKTDL